MITEDKWMPKVGEAFQWRRDESGHWITCDKCIVRSLKAVAYEDSRGWIISVSKECDFRPVQTKSDVEREQLIDILRKNYILAEGGVQSIQEAGFTIPKKIKRSDVSALISDWTDLPNVLTSEICNLLGDVVEQDQ